MSVIMPSTSDANAEDIKVLFLVYPFLGETSGEAKPSINGWRWKRSAAMVF